LDVGTNNEDLLSDPLYLGVRQKRLTGDEYDKVVEQFVTAIRRKFPSALLQWEDFGKNNAFRLLDRYRDRMLSFNDDIQGTGSVAMAVFLSAMRIKKQKLSDQTFILFGQGQAGIGVGRQIYTGLLQEGLSHTEAKSRIFGIDIDGLLVEGMAVRDEQKLFLKTRQETSHWKLDDPNKITLLDTIRNSKATVLVGVTGQSGAFDKDIIMAMTDNTNLPLIMPLSNPTAKAECTPEFALSVANGNCLIATGSPFKPVEINGREHIISQCNNLYVFPGVGLGSLVCQTHKVTDEMFMAASRALSNLVTEQDLQAGRMLPPIENIRSVCAQIALAVAKQARQSGLGVRAEDEHLFNMIRAAMWEPKYLPYRYVKE
jgi:malate dehydrogenase (oxaloacetate-decarboxylating)